MELTRRDDFISLCYLITFFVSGEVTWLKGKDLKSPFIVYQIAKIKENLTAADLCLGLARGMEPFV